jgi:hypothetical protein
MIKYTIKRRDEETECCYCAYPLFIGDTAYMSADERNVYCSKACAGVTEPAAESMLEKAASATYGRRVVKGVKAGCFDV